MASVRAEPLGLDQPLWRVVMVEDYRGGGALITPLTTRSRMGCG
ncbi:MAG: hypothetical protein R2716_08920 [Microthrixaceae bacterium]